MCDKPKASIGRLSFYTLVFVVVFILYLTDPTVFIEKVGLAVLVVLTLDNAYEKLRSRRTKNANGNS